MELACNVSTSWPTVEERVERWAQDVQRDIETPDLWAELQREREILTRTTRLG